jgi:serine/threonine protein kinase
LSVGVSRFRQAALRQEETMGRQEQPIRPGPPRTPPASLPSAMTPLTISDPDRIGSYRLLARLGVGAMGHVYLGRHVDTGTWVAVKAIRPDLAHEPVFRQRFARELATMRRVTSPFVAALVDGDAAAAQPWLATAYTPAITLQQAVDTHGALPPQTVRVLAAGILHALVALHAAGVIHRDLQPSNVLLCADGPRIIDFGIVQALGGTHLTTAGARLGSASFMAPELATGVSVGPPADLFGLGALVAYALTGQPPFGEGSPEAVLYRVVHTDPDLRALARVDANLHALAAGCLRKNPAQRPTAPAAIRSLQPISEYGSAGWLPPPVAAAIGQTTTARDSYRPVPSHRPQIILRFGLAPLVLVAGIVGALLVAQGHPQDTLQDTPPSPLTVPSDNQPAPRLVLPATSIAAPPTSAAASPQATRSTAPPEGRCPRDPSRATCDLRYAAGQGCESDAVTVPGGTLTATLHGVSFTVRLLWSPRCRTNWTRARPAGGQPTYFADWIEPDRHDATRYSSPWQTRGGWLISPMAYSDGSLTAAAACVMVAGSVQPYWACTPRLLPDGTNVG